MSTDETISWILLATAFASEQTPTDYDSISRVADGINHAVPTDKEMQTSLKWLMTSGLVNKTGKTYSLTSDGQSMLERAQSRTNTIVLNIWSELTKEIEKTRKPNIN